MSVLTKVLRTAERSFRNHPVFLFGVIVDVVLAGLALVLPDGRLALVLIVGVSVLVVLLWQWGRWPGRRKVTITNGRDISIRNSLNHGSRDRGRTGLTISGGTGVIVDNSLNSDDPGHRAAPPDSDRPAPG